MPLENLRSIVGRRPLWIIASWLALAVGVGVSAPDLSRVTAEGQTRLLGPDSESLHAEAIIHDAWPDRTHGSMAVAALHRPEGLTDDDRAFARRLAGHWQRDGLPDEILRVLGPDSAKEIAERLTSKDGTMQLIAVPLASMFVSPKAHEAVAWLQSWKDEPGLSPPPGLEVHWAGDAVTGRDYMENVQTSLDRAAVVTVILLLIVLLIVYRSAWLALIPLVTIGVSLIISRGLLAWLMLAGWEISPLAELFLVALLFGTGTDFCLFISWRYGEHFDADDPVRAMAVTLRKSFLALVTSAGTVIIGLALMGTTRFKLFSSTGPSVAVGLVLTLAATLSLTPALLVVLARLRPRAFSGLTAPSSGFWGHLGRRAMARPVLSWLAAFALMTPLALLSLRTSFVQDLMGELPKATPSSRVFHSIAAKFGPGFVAPLSVVIESDTDLHDSAGLALIDDLSRLLAHQRRLLEVRSATQPLGSPEPLARARLDSRLGEVNVGFARMAQGANQLQKGLTEGAAKLRAAVWLEEKLARSSTARRSPEGPATPPPPTSPERGKVDSEVGRVSTDFLGVGKASRWLGLSSSGRRTEPKEAPTNESPKATMLRDLTRAAEGVSLIAQGAEQAHREVAMILDDPVGRRALNRLLITPETVRDHPELNASFHAYITPDGHQARIDLTQADRVFSAGAMDQVLTLRKRLDDYLGEVEGMSVRASVTGANAESADIREMTRADQFRSWFVIPIGVFLVLLVALRDPLACFNLVGTMLLTYGFALGTTHLVFVTGLGLEGLDWKVPYFLFVLLVAIGVDYNVFLMDRVRQESETLGPRMGIIRAIGRTGGLITSAAAITACSFASFLSSPLVSLRQLGFALVVGILLDALLVRPLLVPCGHWLLTRGRPDRRPSRPARPCPAMEIGSVLQYAE